MKVAIQGLDASFHSLAAKSIFGAATDLVFCKTFKDVFAAINSAETEAGVVAIENSLYGSINEVYDLLLKHDFSIQAEVYEEIGLHLLGQPGADLADITDIYSQVMALSESSEFLETKLGHAEIHEHADTALAAKEVAELKDRSKAAVASKAAAELYGLDIISKNIETHHQNYTRFLALSKNKQPIGHANKTSITFQTADVPGALYTVLGLFAKRGVNLTKLESRPIVGAAWQYMYYIDFDAGIQTAAVGSIMEQLPKHASNIRILGSYKAGLVEKS